MTIRTTRTTVSFSQPFKLKDLDDLQPAGDYIRIPAPKAVLREAAFV